MSCSGVHTPLQTIIARGGLVTDFLGGPGLRASAPCLSGGDASLLASHAPSAAFPLRTTPANPSSLMPPSHRLRGDSSHSRSRGGSPRWRCWPRTRARGSRRTSRPSSRPTSGSGSSVPVLRAVAQPMARSGLALGTRPAAVAMHGQNQGISRAARARVGVNNMSYTVNSASGTESASYTHASSLDIEYSVHWFGRNGHMPFWEGHCYMSVRIKFSGDMLCHCQSL